MKHPLISVSMVAIEILWRRRGNDVHLRLCRFWARLLGLACGTGVVTGDVLPFEFGGHRPLLPRHRHVPGPLLSYGALMAFLLEAGLLPVMLLGWGRRAPAPTATTSRRHAGSGRGASISAPAPRWPRLARERCMATMYRAWRYRHRRTPADEDLEKRT